MVSRKINAALYISRGRSFGDIQAEIVQNAKEIKFNNYVGLW